MAKVNHVSYGFEREKREKKHHDSWREDRREREAEDVRDS